MDNSVFSFLTKIWGPGAWTFLHTISFGYPNNPTNEDKQRFKEFFRLIGFVLPCCYCRDSYQRFIQEDDTELNDAVMENRETLSKWFYNIHNKVNKKLGINYNVNYSDIVARYETYQAKCVHDAEKNGCIIPLSRKSTAYTMVEYKDCPVIPYELALCFENYAKKRNVNFDKINKCKNLSNDHACEEWKERNKLCSEIISTMRKTGIPSVEQDGEWKGLPTVNELQLISNLSTTMSKNELITLANKLGYNVIKTYKLSSY